MNSFEYDNQTCGNQIQNPLMYLNSFRENSSQQKLERSKLEFSKLQSGSKIKFKKNKQIMRGHIVQFNPMTQSIIDYFFFILSEQEFQKLQQNMGSHQNQSNFQRSPDIRDQFIGKNLKQSIKSQGQPNKNIFTQQEYTESKYSSPDSKKQQNLYKKMYQQVLDNETSEILSKLQQQFDNVCMMIEQDYNKQEVISNIDSIINEQKTQNEKFLNENEKNLIYFEDQKLREDIANINQQLKKPLIFKIDKFEELNDIIQKHKYINEQDKAIGQFNLFEQKYKMLGKSRSQNKYIR